MMNLKEIKQKSIIYLQPKFAREYDEAMRYPMFKDMSVDEWVKFCNTGFEMRMLNYLFGQVNNTEGTSVESAKANFDKLDPDKIKRFKNSYEMGIIEMPIILRQGKMSYELIAGNTRFTGLVALGYEPHVWLIQL